MDITKITLLDFGVDERGEQFARIEFAPLIGESKNVHVIVLRKGDSLTTDAPIVNDAAKPEPKDVKK